MYRVVVSNTYTVSHNGSTCMRDRVDAITYPSSMLHVVPPLEMLIETNTDTHTRTSIEYTALILSVGVVKDQNHALLTVLSAGHAAR